MKAIYNYNLEMNQKWDKPKNVFDKLINSLIYLPLNLGYCPVS